MFESDSKKNDKKLSKKKSSDEFLVIKQRISIDNIEEHFPTIYREISDKPMSLKISEVNSGFESSLTEEDKSIDRDPLHKYDPDVYDFLARAKTTKEGEEIVEFLEKQGQISTEMANQIKEQLKNQGVRSFGPMRVPDHYFRKAAEICDHRSIKKRYPVQNNNKYKE